MIAVELSFPAGKWHATPWGRQVNEGAIEWPPSPWRLLRALLAVWHLKYPDVPEKDIRSLVDELIPLPSYTLPRASQGHTRHYMPVANDNRTKVFDTFIAVPRRDPIIVVWQQVELSPPQRQLLAQLLRGMAYFGRAESWVDAVLLNSWEGRANAAPLNGGGLDGNQELVRLLAPASIESYQAWREQMANDLTARKLKEQRAKDREKGRTAEAAKLSAKEQQAVAAMLPNSVFDALHADTNTLRAEGWNRPPGSEWVDYVRDKDAFASESQRSTRTRTGACPTTARYALCGAVRPLLTEAISVAERVRTGVMSQSKGVAGNARPVFSGRLEDGGRLDDGHRHAHFLCEANSPKDGRISHVTVFAPMGFKRDDEIAIARLMKVWGRGGHDLQLVLLGVGRPEDFGGLHANAGQSAILHEARVWVSRTPFVLTRHLKVKRADRRDPETRYQAEAEELVNAVRRELRNRPQWEPFAESVDIEWLSGREAGTWLGGHFTSWLKFRRERKEGDGRHAGSLGYGFRLTFDQPVRGPIALGYGCHFGLGQFVPEDAE